MESYNFIRWFADLGIQDIPSVGGKNASLGQLSHALSGTGLSVPNGFALTSDGYYHFLEYNKLQGTISDLLSNLDTRDTQQLQSVGRQIRNQFLNASFPLELKKQVLHAYKQLGSADVAVRSSATAEDLPDASFAGQQETYLNISGEDEVIAACQKCFASLYTDRAISYRVDKHYNHMQVALSIGIQKMVRSDLASSGVIFTLDTESGFDKTILVTSAYGLGENVVQGAVNPDEFVLYKPCLEQNRPPILKRHLGEKAIKMRYARLKHHVSTIENVNVEPDDRHRFSISDSEVTQLGLAALNIEKHYSELAKTWRPMDIEWAKDGNTGKLFILQARPETVHSQRSTTTQESYHLIEKSKVLVTGKSVGNKIIAGKCRVILDAARMGELQPGEILITDITDPDWEPVMKISAGIVTNRGGRTCHAAIIARELGIPAIVGAGNATETIKDGQLATLSCVEGDVGTLYEGELKFEHHEYEVKTQKLKTKVMLILGNPKLAFERQALPNDGVGLARLEFIIGSTIGIHPNAAIYPEKLTPEEREHIISHCHGYDSPTDFYVKKLSEGIATIGAAFYPRPVIVRMSDFKSNEYAQLMGGTYFEPNEENPMIGFRGASRYPSELFKEAFKLECKALKYVREEQGLSNIALMIPFVRSVNELLAVKAIMAEEGLVPGVQDLKLYVMCEIPSNALLADDFLEHCDGFSIGSNDLTQLTLGVDRDSSLIPDHDERDKAVLKLMGMAIDACQKANKYIGICGQAPSDFPEITQWLVEKGIYSISLNADSLLNMRDIVAKYEHS